MVLVNSLMLIFEMLNGKFVSTISHGFESSNLRSAGFEVDIVLTELEICCEFCP